MQTFGALPEAQALQADSRPAWIWSSDGARILWANAAGARRLGARCLEDLGQRRYPDSHPLRHDVQNAARRAGPDGVAAAGLRIVAQPRAAPVACEIRRIIVPQGHDGILVVAQGSSEAASVRSHGGPQPSPGVDMPSPVRSPIPEWLRARLATYPPSARQGAAGRAGEGMAPQKPCAAGLSPEEQSAFQEIALALGSTTALGARATRPPQPPADDDPGPADEAGRRVSQAIQPGDIPSAFCGPAVSPSFKPEEDVARRLDGSEARLREVASILDIATDGVVILDGDGRIESLNGSAEALFGVRQPDVAGQPFADLLAPDSRSVAMGYLADVKADGVAGLINGGRELEGQVKGGTLPLFVTFGRIGGGEAGARFCAVLRDLTQWKQAEAELVAARRRAEEASSHKSDFLARVSHEIRTPLNGIIGFAEVIVEERFGPLPNARYREYVRDIRSSGEHVLSLVNDLLDIAKIEAGKLELNFATVQLNQLVRECVMLMQPAASGARII
ncbi:MAG TPA: histidine kinase dimerization/phospho-acceptor domain-containing protein, partial [Afifellaceae bacterium]|nr:histidine kinase dimerization/phospho-acceptor domain-containing protein [Afifellaceae bacterium]